MGLNVGLIKFRIHIVSVESIYIWEVMKYNWVPRPEIIKVSIWAQKSPYE